MPGSKWPGCRQAKSKVPGLVNCQTSSPVLPASTDTMVGSACSISGNFCISTACAFNSFIDPSTISCLTLPAFFTTNLTVSPRFTLMFGGGKRMASLISASVVRDIFMGSPGLPSAFGWPSPCFGSLPDSCSSLCAKAPVTVRLRAMMETMSNDFIDRCLPNTTFDWPVEPTMRSRFRRSVRTMRSPLHDFQNGFTGPGHHFFEARRANRGQWLAGPFVSRGARRLLVPARVLVVVAGQPFANFDHGEHAPHFHAAERTLTGHHRQGVVWQPHFHVAHASAGISHHHVFGERVPYFLYHP